MSRVLYTDRTVTACDFHSSAYFSRLLPPPLPLPLLISFFFLQSTSFYQFFPIICSLFLCISSLFGFLFLYTYLSSLFHLIHLFFFPPTELILLCDSAVMWPILGSHHKSTSNWISSKSFFFFCQKSNKKQDPMEINLMGLDPVSLFQIAILW